MATLRSAKAAVSADIRRILMWSHEIVETS